MSGDYEVIVLLTSKFGKKIKFGSKGYYSMKIYYEFVVTITAIYCTWSKYHFISVVPNRGSNSRIILTVNVIKRSLPK